MTGDSALVDAAALVGLLLSHLVGLIGLLLVLNQGLIPEFRLLCGDLLLISGAITPPVWVDEWV